MPDYQNMYCHLFRSTTDAILLLEQAKQQAFTQQRMLQHAIEHMKQAQQETEELYLQGDAPLTKLEKQ